MPGFLGFIQLSQFKEVCVIANLFVFHLELASVIKKTIFIGLLM